MTRTSTPKVYKPKNPQPLPRGKLTLYTTYNRHFLGRDEEFGENDSSPILTVNSDIHLETDSDTKNSLRGTKIGWLQGWVIQRARITNEGYNFWEVCDTPDEETEKLASMLCDEYGDFKYELNEPFSYMMSGDIFYLKSIYLKERYRGYGIGLLAMSHFIDTLPSFSQDTVVLSPLPIRGCMLPKRPDGTEEPTLGKQAYEKATARLAEYWSLLGLEKLTTDEQEKEGGYPFYGLTTALINPKAKDILPHLFQGKEYEEVEYEPEEKDEPIIETEADVEEKWRQLSVPLMQGLLEGTRTFDQLPHSVGFKRIYKEYKGRANKPFPPGYFYLTLDYQKSYMGPDAALNGYPVVPLLFKLLYASNLDADPESCEIAGMIDARLIRRDQMLNVGIDFRSACARTMKELGQCVKALYDTKGDYREPGKKEGIFMDEYSHGDILYIKHVEIKTAFRGHGLSLLAISRMIDMMPSFQGDTILIPLDSTDEKLKAHFSLMGFHSFMHKGPIDGKDYHGICTAYVQTPIHKVVPKAFVRRTQKEFYEVHGEKGIVVPGAPIFGHSHTDMMFMGRLARRVGQEARKKGDQSMLNGFMASMMGGMFPGM